jgi:hypothetical protein
MNSIEELESKLKKLDPLAPSPELRSRCLAVGTKAMSPVSWSAKWRQPAYAWALAAGILMVGLLSWNLYENSHLAMLQYAHTVSSPTPSYTQGQMRASFGLHHEPWTVATGRSHVVSADSLWQKRQEQLHAVK